MVELAIATGIPVSAWLAEPDGVILTALDVLAERAERSKHHGR